MKESDYFSTASYSAYLVSCNVTIQQVSSFHHSLVTLGSTL